MEWKLVGIDPPKQMLIQLAQEPLKQRADKKDCPQLANDSAFVKAFALRFGSGRMATQACCVTLTSGASLAFRPSAACCLGFGKDGSTVYV